MIDPQDPVSTVATFDVVGAAPTDTLRDLASSMTAAGCGALVVQRSKGERAIVSERDIVQALAGGATPDSDWATDVMTREVMEVGPDTPITEVARLMLEAGIRHVVVADPGVERVGIVSIRDVVEPLLEAASGT